MRWLGSYLRGYVNSLNPLHHSAIWPQAALSIPKRATHSAGSTIGTAEFLGHPNALLSRSATKIAWATRDLPAQRRVHRVLKQIVIEQAVTANRMKVGLPVD